MKIWNMEINGMWSDSRNLIVGGPSDLKSDSDIMLKNVIGHNPTLQNRIVRWGTSLYINSFDAQTLISNIWHEHVLISGDNPYPTSGFCRIEIGPITFRNSNIDGLSIDLTRNKWHFLHKKNYKSVAYVNTSSTSQYCWVEIGPTTFLNSNIDGLLIDSSRNKSTFFAKKNNYKSVADVNISSAYVLNINRGDDMKIMNHDL